MGPLVHKRTGRSAVGVGSVDGRTGAEVKREVPGEGVRGQLGIELNGQLLGDEWAHYYRVSSCQSIGLTGQ